MAFDFAVRFDGRFLATPEQRHPKSRRSGDRPVRSASVHPHAHRVPSRSPIRPARLGSARLGSAWLGLAWLGVARPTTRSNASARGSSARETITSGVTRLSTSARANHGRLRRAARWRLRRLWVRNARPPPLLPRRVRRFLFVAPFHPLCPAPSHNRSLARSHSVSVRASIGGGGDSIKNRPTKRSATGRDWRREPWHGLGRDAIWRTVRRANECPRWPLRATRTTMGDTERALYASPPPLRPASHRTAPLRRPGRSPPPR